MVRNRLIIILFISDIFCNTTKYFNVIIWIWWYHNHFCSRSNNDLHDNTIKVPWQWIFSNYCCSWWNDQRKLHFYSQFSFEHDILYQILLLCNLNRHAFICVVRPWLLNIIVTGSLHNNKNNKRRQSLNILSRPILFWFQKYFIDQISCFCFLTISWINFCSYTIFQESENKRHHFKNEN